MSAFAKIKPWLIKRADNHKQNLFLLICGAGAFFIGTALIIWADRALPSSVEQELVALLGTLLSVAGCLSAIFGYLGLSILRLFRFFNDQDANQGSDHPEPSDKKVKEQ